MKLENSIGWCDTTGNKVIGCDKVSEGCKNCYAEVGTAARIRRASGLETWGPAGERVPVAGFTTKLRRLNAQCICDNCHELLPFAFIGKTHVCDKGSAKGVCRRIRVFADSNSDWLDIRWSVQTLTELLHDIFTCQNLDFLLLTKRIERWRQALLSVEAHMALTETYSTAFFNWIDDWLKGRVPAAAGNVWLGVSVENQKRADERIPLLAKTPAAVRFLSVEPLLSSINLENHLLPSVSDVQKTVAGEPTDWPRLHWIIVGAESGKNRRDCGVAAIISVVEQGMAAGVAVYLKQDCVFKSGQQGRIPDKIWQLKQLPR